MLKFIIQIFSRSSLKDLSKFGVWNEIKRVLKSILVIAVVGAVGFLIYKAVNEYQGISFSKETISRKINELTEKTAEELTALKEKGQEALARESAKVAIAGLESLKNEIEEKIEGLQAEYNIEPATESVPPTSISGSGQSMIQVLQQSQTLSLSINAAAGSKYEIQWGDYTTAAGTVEKTPHILTHSYKTSGEYIVSTTLVEKGKTYAETLAIKITK